MDNTPLTAPSKLLNEEQQDDVKKKVIALFGEEVVHAIDMQFMAFTDQRMAATDAYDFLKKVADQDPEHAVTTCAALLFGMKMGEISAQFVLTQQHEQEIEKVKAEAAKDQDGAVIAPHTTFSEGMYY
jgi:hypothetical protein